MDFIQAISPDQFVRFDLGGRPVQVYRAKLGVHLQLMTIAESLKDEQSPVQASALLLRYLHTAGLDGQIIKDGRPIDLIRAFVILYTLNGWTWTIPLIDPKRADGRPSPPPDYDYPGRRWAVWIHRIAQAYGWSKDDILNLWPEEAAVYIQEILVSDYYDREERRSLSELAYSADPGGKTHRFNPSPMPSWMKSPEVKTIRIRRSALPVGNVVGKDQAAE